MKKRIMTTLLSLCILCSMAVPVLAGETMVQNEEKEISIQSAMEYAYLDMDVVSPAIKEKVLDARKVIASTKEWVADGYTAHIEDNEGNIIRTIPSYSEVFPGWDLPMDDDLPNMETTFIDYGTFINAKSMAALDPSAWKLFRSIADVKLLSANSTGNLPFYYFHAHPYDIGNEIKTVVTSLTTSQTCNVSFTENSTQTVIGYAIKLATNQQYVVGGVSDKTLSVKASTYSTPGGFAGFKFYGADRKVDTWD